MYSDSINFIYTATNEIAAGQYDPEAECVLSAIIEQELLSINFRPLLMAAEEGEETGMRADSKDAARGI